MKPYLIGVAGPSCAGKGEIAGWLSQHLEAAVLDLDGYYRDQRDIPFETRRLMNYDVPSALDTDLLFRQIRRIADGEGIDKPSYDFTRHTRNEGTTRFEPAPYVIVDGLFALYWPELRAVMDLKVFVDAPDDECLRRRVARDTTERGRERDDVIRQVTQQVLPAAAEYVRPTRAFADLVVDGRLGWAENGARIFQWIVQSRRAQASTSNSG
ncbi:MAG: uridine kinase [Bryobacterales bacterium]|nr:uridine kinase [Bryobacterales bacterium]